MSEPAFGQASGGALLRAAREKQGLHIAALAAAIKVAPRKLDALENDRWDELPDATFARALAQTVCRTLKIDPRPVLDRLPPAGGAAFENAPEGLNAPFRERPGRDDSGLAVTAVRPMVWAAAVLMLAAVAVYFWPAGWLTDSRASAAAQAASAAAAASAAEAAAVAAAASAVPMPPAPAASEAIAAAVEAPSVAAAEPVAAKAVAVTAASAPAAVAAVMATAPTAASALATRASPTGIIQLSTRDASWIEARDAGGRLLLSRLVTAGESVGLDGALPVRLTIGNAAATQLAFRGQAVDLQPSTRDNVARVELK
jgi:cytoskeleton protein RodZ